jgi:hypothetical protein
MARWLTLEKSSFDQSLRSAPANPDPVPSLVSGRLEVVCFACDIEGGERGLRHILGGGLRRGLEVAIYCLVLLGREQRHILWVGRSYSGKGFSPPHGALQPSRGQIIGGGTRVTVGLPALHQELGIFD